MTKPVEKPAEDIQTDTLPPELKRVRDRLVKVREAIKAAEPKQPAAIGEFADYLKADRSAPVAEFADHLKASGSAAVYEWADGSSPPRAPAPQKN
ncbi:MAG TPA: hypothetical protein VG056_03100 [Pirellulales bacterium]|jgi:hypothetical protein|nr:hypothetical protein [Pirellulales bacterium]